MVMLDDDKKSMAVGPTPVRGMKRRRPQWCGGPSFVLVCAATIINVLWTTVEAQYITCRERIVTADTNGDGRLAQGEFNRLVYMLSGGIVTEEASVWSLYGTGGGSIDVTGAVPQSATIQQIELVENLCNAVFGSIATALEVNVDQQACMAALQAADINPSNGRLGMPEYSLFVTTLTGEQSVASQSFDRIPQRIQSAFWDFADDDEVRSSRGMAFLLTFCQRTALQVQIQRDAPDPADTEPPERINPATVPPGVSPTNRPTSPRTERPVPTTSPPQLAPQPSRPPQQQPPTTDEFEMSEEQFTSCQRSMLLSDLNRDDRFNQQEFTRFVNRMAGQELDAGSVMAMFTELSGSGDDINVFGFRMGSNPTPQQLDQLRSVCLITYQRIDEINNAPPPPPPTSPPTSPPLPPTLAPTLVPEVVTSAPVATSPTAPTVAPTTSTSQHPSPSSSSSSSPPPQDEFQVICQTGMRLADQNNNSKLERAEFPVFLYHTLGDKYRNVTYDELNPLFRGIFFLFGDGSVIDISGIGQEETPSDVQQSHLEDICKEVASIHLQLGETTDPPRDGPTAAPTIAPQPQPTKNPVDGLSEEEFQQCLTSVQAANTNEDDWLDLAEYVAFLNMITGEMFTGESFANLPEPVRLSYAKARGNNDFIQVPEMDGAGNQESLRSTCLELYNGIRNLDPISTAAPSPSSTSTFLPTCRESLEDADLDRDGFLSEEEYATFLHLVSADIGSLITFAELPYLLRDNFEWIKMGDTVLVVPNLVSKTGFAQATFFCSRTKRVLDIVSRDKQTPLVTLAQQCGKSIINADKNLDNFLDQDEYFHFINEMSGMAWNGLSFSTLEPELQRVFETALTSDSRVLDVSAARQTNQETSERRNAIDSFCINAGQAIDASRGGKVFFQKCLVSLLAANTDSNDILTRAEYSVFLQGLTPSVTENDDFNDLDSVLKINYDRLALRSNDVSISGLNGLHALTSVEADHLRWICDSTQSVLNNMTPSEEFVIVFNSFILKNQRGIGSSDLLYGNMRVTLERAYRNFVRTQVLLLVESRPSIRARRKLAIAGVDLESTILYRIADSKCPEPVETQWICQVVFGSFIIRTVDGNDPDELSSRVSRILQSAIDDGALQAELLKEAPGFAILIHGSSLPLKPITDPSEPKGMDMTLLMTIIGGGAGGLILIAALIYFCSKKKGAKNKASSATADEDSSTNQEQAVPKTLTTQPQTRSENMNSVFGSFTVEDDSVNPFMRRSNLDQSKASHNAELGFGDFIFDDGGRQATDATVASSKIFDRSVASIGDNTWGTLKPREKPEMYDDDESIGLDSLNAESPPQTPIRAANSRSRRHLGNSSRKVGQDRSSRHRRRDGSRRDVSSDHNRGSNRDQRSSRELNDQEQQELQNSSSRRRKEEREYKDRSNSNRGRRSSNGSRRNSNGGRRNSNEGRHNSNSGRSAADDNHTRSPHRNYPGRVKDDNLTVSAVAPEIDDSSILLDVQSLATPRKNFKGSDEYPSYPEAKETFEIGPPLELADDSDPNPESSHEDKGSLEVLNATFAQTEQGSNSKTDGSESSDYESFACEPSNGNEPKSSLNLSDGISKSLLNDLGDETSDGDQVNEVSDGTELGLDNAQEASAVNDNIIDASDEDEEEDEQIKLANLGRFSMMPAKDLPSYHIGDVGASKRSVHISELQAKDLGRSSSESMEPRTLETVGDQRKHGSSPVAATSVSDADKSAATTDEHSSTEDEEESTSNNSGEGTQIEIEEVEASDDDESVEIIVKNVAEDISSVGSESTSMVEEEEIEVIEVIDNEYREPIKELMLQVMPDEIENLDDMLVQFAGREEELIETLNNMLKENEADSNEDASDEVETNSTGDDSNEVESEDEDEESGAAETASAETSQDDDDDDDSEVNDGSEESVTEERISEIAGKQESDSEDGSGEDDSSEDEGDSDEETGTAGEESHQEESIENEEESDDEGDSDEEEESYEEDDSDEDEGSEEEEDDSDEEEESDDDEGSSSTVSS